jgi:hypothetical protein
VVLVVKLCRVAEAVVVQVHGWVAGCDGSLECRGLIQNLRDNEKKTYSVTNELAVFAAACSYYHSKVHFHFQTHPSKHKGEYGTTPT